MVFYILLCGVKIMENQNRNLHPHMPAKCAMWLYGKRYSEQNGGSMDFWDRLSKSDKETCRRMANDIVTARIERDNELNET